MRKPLNFLASLSRRNMKSATLKEIAFLLGAKLVGNPDVVITGMDGIFEAKEGDITFLSNPKYKEQLPLCKASAIIVGPDVEVPDLNLLQVENPRFAFARLMSIAFPPKKEKGEVDSRAIVSATAQLGKNVTLYSNVYVGENAKIGDNSTLYPGVYVGDNAEIGENSLIYPNCTIHDHTKIGSRVIINANSVVGSQGFGFERDGDKHFKVPQIGNVVIEDDVEVGAQCAIDCGTVKSTLIRQGTKLDNFVHVAHNCNIGENNLLLAQTSVAGTVTTGTNVYFGGRAGVMDNQKITDRVVVGPGAVITESIKETGTYFGYPARPYNEWTKASALFYKADEQRKKVLALEKRVKELEDKFST